jgi:hypothetical protein
MLNIKKGMLRETSPSTYLKLISKFFCEVFYNGEKGGNAGEIATDINNSNNPIIIGEFVGRS